MTEANSRPARRDVLKALGLGATATAAPIAAQPASAAIETQAERRKARYQETAQVKRYYETNRYPK